MTPIMDSDLLRAYEAALPHYEQLRDAVVAHTTRLLHFLLGATYRQIFQFELARFMNRPPHFVFVAALVGNHLTFLRS